MLFTPFDFSLPPFSYIFSYVSLFTVQFFFSPFSSFSCFCTGCFALSAQPPLVEEFRIFTGFVVQRRLISVRRIQKPLFRGGEQQPPPLFGHVPRFKVAFLSSERLFIRLKINPLPSFSLSLSLSLSFSLSLSLFLFESRSNFRGLRSCF